MNRLKEIFCLHPELYDYCTNVIHLYCKLIFIISRNILVILVARARGGETSRVGPASWKRCATEGVFSFRSEAVRNYFLVIVMFIKKLVFLLSFFLLI